VRVGAARGKKRDVDLDTARAAFDRERRDLDVRGFRRIASTELVRHVPDGTLADHRGGFVSYSRHPERDIEQAITAVIAAFAAVDGGFEWKAFEHDQPADLVSRLARRGFRIEESEEMLVMELAAAAPLLEARSGHRVRRVDDERTFADYKAVASAVWPDKELHTAWLDQELRDPASETALYVAYAGDRPAASARASFPHGSAFAGLWAGATLPAHRRQGLYAALVAARAREAAARGFRYLMVDALPTSRSSLLRMGFARLTASRPCLWP
jgi:GNAT superfamily N-acetyltransferase